MSALPPRADIRCRNWHVRFVPKADISISLADLIAKVDEAIAQK
jgi:hypothetical protein